MFTHFFYIPIALAGFWWGTRGVSVAILLGVLLIAFHLLSGLDVPILSDLQRLAIFLVVGTLVGTLRERNIKVELALRKSHDELETRVKERTTELARANEALQTEIAERMQMELKIAESEHYLNNIIESSSDSIISLDSKGNIVLFNEGAERIFGYRREELIGKNIVEGGEVKIFEDIKTAKYMMQKMRESNNGKVSNLEVTGETRDGRKIYATISASLLKNEKGEIIGSLGVARDITERRKIEEALRESEERYRTIIEYSNDMIWTLDTEGRFTFFNNRSEEITGFKLEDWRGKPFAPLIEKEDLPRIAEVFHKTLNGEPQQYDVSLKKKDGSDLILSVTTAPIFSKGKAVGTVSFGRDITERRQLEQQLQKAYAELKEQYNRKMDFTNVAAHELKTPMVPIVGYLSLMKNEIEDEKMLRYIDIMEHNAQRQLRLVDRMLELSRLDAGKVELEYTDVNVNELIQDLLDSYAAMGQKFEVNIPENFVIHVDEDKFLQILDNLFSNAIKYSPEGTEVKISVEERGSDYLFKVKDQGVGIADEDKKRIFERFYIAGGEKKARAAHRTGLGLSLAKHYVELHGGRIWVESEPGKGSTFYFTIPK